MFKEEEKKEENDFEKLEENSNILVEFWEFLSENKKLWLIPIIIILLLLGFLIFLGSTAAAPFVYTLF